MRVKIIILTFAAAGLAAALALTTTPGHAATWGHAKWCAVTDQGAGDIMWECVYDSAEECQPFIVGGNRGFCALNPYWKVPNAPPDY
jgi:Protein of unknown function (DUF3551)